MAGILDYLEWRGDISFETDQFNEIDDKTNKIKAEKFFAKKMQLRTTEVKLIYQLLKTSFSKGTHAKKYLMRRLILQKHLFLWMKW